MPGPMAQGHIISPGKLTPTPQRQAAFVGGALGVATVGALPGGIQVRLLNLGAKAYAGMIAMGDAYPALGPNYKFGFRYGGTGEMTTMGRAIPVTAAIYGPIATKIPFPDVGYGLTAVPNDSSRWVYEMNKSRPGENTSSSQVVSGPLQTRKSMRGALAPSRGRSGPSSRKPRGMISFANRRGAPSSGRRRPRPPYCATHKRRHWCRITRKR